MQVQRLEVNEQNDGELDYPSHCGDCGNQYLTLKVKNYKFDRSVGLSVNVGLSVVVSCPSCEWYQRIYEGLIE